MRATPRSPLLGSALLVLLLAGPPRADDEPTRLPLPETVPTYSQWYGIYIQGKKCGYANESLQAPGPGDLAPWRYAMRGEFKVKAMGQESDTTFSEFREFDATLPYALRRAESTMKEGDDVQRIELVQKAGRHFGGRVTQAGQASDRPVADFDYTLADLVTPLVWVGGARKVGDVLRYRDLDLDRLEASVETLRVTGTGEAMTAGIKVPYLDLFQSSSLTGDVGALRMDGHGTTLSAKIGGLLDIRLEPEEVAKQIEVSGDLFLLSIVRVDKPLGGDAPRIRRLVLEARGETSSQFASGPRQQVTKDASGTVVLTLGPDAKGDYPATPEEIRENLRETVDYPIHDPKVVAFAEQAVLGATTDREKVARLVHRVGQFVDDAVVTEQVPVLRILETHKGDCSEHALLFAAVARAVGIPTREVGGLLYMGDEFKAFGGHAWDEVVLDGKWVPVDPSWEETEVDASHVMLSRDPKDSMKETAVLGGHVTFVLRSVDVAPKPDEK